MALKRMDNVLIVVEDIEAFFIARGMVREGGMTVEGSWVDRIIGSTAPIPTLSLSGRLTVTDASSLTGFIDRRRCGVKL